MPSDPDEVLDTVTDDVYNKDRFLPYWAEHWPSSEPFSHFISSQSLSGIENVCELGSGLGVLSTVLSYRGKTVYSIDISYESCCYASCTMMVNKLTPKMVCADWRHLPFKGFFDLMVASDVLYEERWIAVILDCIKQHLAPGGKALIADPCRCHWETFKRKALLANFSVDILHSAFINNGKSVVEILQLGKD